MSDIQKLRDDVIEAAKEWRLDTNRSVVDNLSKALRELEAAEKTAPRQGLRRPGAVIVEAGGKYWCVPELIVARDNEWLMAIRGLRTRERAHDPSEGVCWPRSRPSYEKTVDLSDIEAMAAGAKE